MPVKYNNKPVNNIKYNNNQLSVLYYNNVLVWSSSKMFGYKDAISFSETIYDNKPSNNKYKEVNKYGYKEAASFSPSTLEEPTGYYKIEKEAKEVLKEDNKSQEGVAGPNVKEWGPQGGNVEHNSGGYAIDLGGKAIRGTVTASISGCQCEGHQGKRNVGIWGSNDPNTFGDRPPSNYYQYKNLTGITNGTVTVDNFSGYRYLIIGYALGCWNYTTCEYSILVDGTINHYFSVSSWKEPIYSDTKTEPYIEVNGTEDNPIQPLTKTGYKEVTGWGELVQTETELEATPTRKIMVSYDEGITWRDYK